MDPNKDPARTEEEQSTQRRARVLGMNYYDTTEAAPKTLYKQWLPIPELYRYKVIPVRSDRSNILFGVTTTTSQQTMQQLQQRFADQRVSFALISDAGFREYMR